MRKLMYFTIGFAAACGMKAYGLPREWGWLVLGLGAMCAVFLGLCSGKRSNYAAVALILLGLALGTGWYSLFQSVYLKPAMALDGRTEPLTIRTTDYSLDTDYGISVEGTLELEGRMYRVRVYLDESEPLEPGTLLTGSFRFAMTAPGEEPVSYLSGSGIFLIARQEDALQLETAAAPGWPDRIARLRRSIGMILDVCFPEDVLPFVRALLLGDTTLLDYKTDTDFKVSGIRHVVAVSGLHVSILFALLGTVTFRRKYLMVPVGLGTLLLFAALAGFSPSVTRACIMSGLLLLALLFDRQYDGPTALSFAVLIMLLGNPLVIASVGFQLSVASVAGIYCFRQGIGQWLLACYPHPKGKTIPSALTRWFDSSVSASLSAMVFTTPLCAWYFGMVSLVGVVTNLLALWVISGIFYGIMAVCILYTLWPGFAFFLGRVVAWPVRYVLSVAGMMADVPLAAVYMESIYMVLWLIFVYALLTVFSLSRNRRAGQLFCCAVLGLCLALTASWWEENAGDPCISVLDVGQGQCILVQSAGKTWMVDCGGDSDRASADIAAAALLSRGISRLDGMILTHLDEDHAAGAENLLTRVDTDLLILPPERTEIASLTCAKVIYARENLELASADTRITVFAATYPGSSNEKSLCVLFDTEKCDILITGDRTGFGERMLLRYADIPDVDVMIAGHHGSKHSTCEELLAAVRPEVVCISAGEKNPFGHPAPELLQRLAEFGCTVYRTDIHGTITIRR
nr:DNA internalization-related competence protein ComEC/Rec2 [Oscillospiraceae bacterium]